MSLVPYIVSDFAAHSLLPLTNLLAFVVSGVIQLPLSKVINLFGHIHELVMVVIMETIGNIQRNRDVHTTVNTDKYSPFRSHSHGYLPECRMVFSRICQSSWCLFPYDKN